MQGLLPGPSTVVLFGPGKARMPLSVKYRMLCDSTRTFGRGTYRHNRIVRAVCSPEGAIGITATFIRSTIKELDTEQAGTSVFIYFYLLLAAGAGVAAPSSLLGSFFKVFFTRY